MIRRLARPFVLFAALVAVSGRAVAEEAAAESAPVEPARAEPAAAEAARAEPAAETEADLAPSAVEWGVGARLRWIFVPRGLIELFLADAASGVGSPGFGLEAVRRKGDLEIALGLEYESLSPADGFYREKGGDDSPGSVSAKTDFTEFDGFSWLTLDATIVLHRQLAPKFFLRYGAGLGFGILLGEVRQTDAICTSADVADDCVAATSGQVDDPADTPPVFPVVNLLVGGQYRHDDKLSFNLELGLRTVFYTGVGATYYF
jgi:hypothetical protein